MFLSRLLALATVALCSAAVCAQDALAVKGQVAPSDAQPSLAKDAQCDADLPPAGHAAEPAGPIQLEFTVGKGVLGASVQGREPGFFGAVLLSTSPDQMHFLTGLPPILNDFVVMGIGFAGGSELQLKVPSKAPWDQLKVYGQALVVDSGGLAASEVVRV